jgi:hypothetical protein
MVSFNPVFGILIPVFVLNQDFRLLHPLLVTQQSISWTLNAVIMMMFCFNLKLQSIGTMNPFFAFPHRLGCLDPFFGITTIHLLDCCIHNWSIVSVNPAIHLMDC